jgi:hypothetical protein
MLGAVEDGFWKQAETITSVLEHVSILLAAIAAAIKFRMLHLLSHRYKSELQCHHYVLSDQQIVFEAEYTVNNTGERPLYLTGVSLRLCSAQSRDGLLLPDQERVFAERLHQPADSDKRGLFQIEAGERSMFTIRTLLTNLEPVTFVSCQLSWQNRRQPAPYVGMYVREDGAASSPQLAQTAKATSAGK